MPDVVGQTVETVEIPQVQFLDEVHARCGWPDSGDRGDSTGPLLGRGSVHARCGWLLDEFLALSCENWTQKSLRRSAHGNLDIIFEQFV